MDSSIAGVASDISSSGTFMTVINIDNSFSSSELYTRLVLQCARKSVWVGLLLFVYEVTEV